MFQVIGENQGRVGFAQFMNYMFLMLDNDQFRKTEFIFKLICPIDVDKFSFNDLFEFYQMIDGSDHFAYLSPDQQKKEIELAETVYEMIGKKNNSFVTLQEFVKFCQIEKENLSLFNFLNSETKITKQNIEKRKAYNDIMQVIQKIEQNADIIQNFLVPEDKKLQNHRFSKRLETLVQIQLIKNNTSKREINNNLNRSVNAQELETLKDNNFEQRHKSIIGLQNFGVAQKRIKKKFQEMIEQISFLKEKIEGLFKNDSRIVIEEELEKNIEEKNFSDKSKLAFINNPNWNIVTNMVQGINLSVNAVCSQEYRPVNKKDFEFVNTFEMSPYSQDVFDHFKFKDYAPYVFENLRREYGIHYTDYLNSLGTKTFQTAFFEKLQVMISEESAGKSGSFFFHTCDSKFLIKTIKQSEVKNLLNLLPQFHNHIVQNPKTLINKFFGLHRMECFKNTQLQFKVYILVMNNVFENVNLKSLQEVYDLKGSTFQRETTQEDVIKGKPKKDLNFTNEKRKIFLKESEKYRILETIDKDTNFLMNNNLIDYSLLIGISDKPIGHSADQKYVQGTYNNSKKSKYYIGIIDILTGFNTMKKGEFFTKRLFQGGGISCVPPKKYQKRFYQFVKESIQVSKF